MTATDRLMTQLLEVHEPGEFFGPAPLAYTSRHGGALAIVGAHTGWAWCWCQPRVTMVPTACPHGSHAQVSHRRVHDMAEAAYDADPRATWEVMDDGSTYPENQEPVQ